MSGSLCRHNQPALRLVAALDRLQDLADAARRMSEQPPSLFGETELETAHREGRNSAFRTVAECLDLIVKGEWTGVVQ